MNEVDIYIKSFPPEVQERLTTIRNIITEWAPQATERICMRIPTYDLNGKWLVHFAGYKKHISLYPQPEGITAFKEKLVNYKTSKRTTSNLGSVYIHPGVNKNYILWTHKEQSGSGIMSWGFL